MPMELPTLHMRKRRPQLPPHLGADHFTVYGESDKYELTLYYPELTAGQEAHLTLYIADYQSDRPMEEKAELKISTLENPQIAFEVMMLFPGVYELHKTLPENKTYTLNVELNHPNGADLIGVKGVAVGQKLSAETVVAKEHSDSNSWMWFIGGLRLGMIGMWLLSRRRNRVLTAVLVLASAWFSSLHWNPAFAHGDEPHGPDSGGGGYGKSVFAPKETQFLFEILTQPIAVGDYQSTTTMFGTVVPASGGLGVVVAPQSGRITRVNVAVGTNGAVPGKHWPFAAKYRDVGASGHCNQQQRISGTTRNRKNPGDCLKARTGATEKNRRHCCRARRTGS